MLNAIRLRVLAGLVLLPLLASHPLRAADDDWFDLAIDQLTLTEGKVPTRVESQDYRNWRLRDWLRAYVVLDGAGEAFTPDPTPISNRLTPNHLFIHTTDHRDVTGRLYVANSDATGMVEVKFKVKATDAKPGAREAFYRAMESHYESLLSRSAPGGAWFRHRAREARLALGDKRDDDNTPRFPFRSTSPDDTFALFTGNQALAENLQLEKALPVFAARPGEKPVAVDSIPGIGRGD